MTPTLVQSKPTQKILPVCPPAKSATRAPVWRSQTCFDFSTLLAGCVFCDITNLDREVVASADDALGTQRHAPHEIFVGATSGRWLRTLASGCIASACFADDTSSQLGHHRRLVVRRRRRGPALQGRHVQEPDVLIGRAGQHEGMAEVHGSDPRKWATISVRLVCVPGPERKHADVPSAMVVLQGVQQRACLGVPDAQRPISRH